MKRWLNGQAFTSWAEVPYYVGVCSLLWALLMWMQ